MIDQPPETAPSPELPDEDRLDLPAEWRYAPNLGGGEPPKTELHPEVLRDAVAEHRQWLLRMLEMEENAEYTPHALAFLDGEPDALGAAVLGILLAWNGDERCTALNPVFDLVAVEHGLPLAACAAVELVSLAAVDLGAGPVLRRAVRGLEPHETGWYWDETTRKLHRIGELLAPDAEEYAAVVESLGRHRDSPLKRLVVSLLVPEERAWLDEVCAEHRNIAPTTPLTRSLADVIGTAEQVEAIGGLENAYPYANASEAPGMVARFGVHALPLLVKRLEYHCSALDEKTLLEAIALLPSDDATAFLLDRLHRPRTMEYALEAASRFPRRTFRLIAERVAEAPPDRRRLLAAVVQADPALFEAVLPTLDPEARDTLAPLADRRGRVPDAPSGALPSPLVDPPWKAKRPKTKSVVIEGLTPPETKRLVWSGEEREAVGPLDDDGPAYYRGGTARFGDERFDYTSFFSYAPIDEARARLHEWTGQNIYATEHELRRILVRFGEEAIDPVTRVLAGEAAVREVLVHILSLDAARLAADWLVRLKTSRVVATAWLDRHAADAAALLVPDALGRAKRLRRAAEAALRHLSVTAGTEPVLAAAERYGPEAVAAVRALTADPLMPVGKKIPAVDALLTPALLPQVLLKGRERALPPEAVEHLVTVLAIATPDYPYGGIDVVAEHCDRESLARFSWAVFEQWLYLGAPSEHSWALTQLIHFADDDTVRDLTPHIMEWPGMNQHRRALTGLEVLGAIGSEAALRAIHTISRKVKFEALKAEATQQIDAVAKELGLSTEQLADRLVPDFGLGEEAALVVDYGPRRFTVGFDEQLQPFVVDERGRRRKTLPKPALKDDAELAQTGRKRFGQLKKELRSVAAEQVRRLERAMVEGRTWSVEEFQRHLVDHPLMWHLTHRLVWMVETGGEWTAFRLAEDRGWADVEEDEVEPPVEAAVRLAHPVLLGERVEAWSEIFADYEILQPFAQLARPAMAFTEEEFATGRLTRFEGREASEGALMGLTNKGWERHSPWEGGWEAGMHHRLPGANTLRIDLAPGTGETSFTLKRVGLSRRGRELSSIDPALASEILSGLAKATRLD